MSKVDEMKAAHPKVDEFLIKKWVRLFDLFFDRNASHNIDDGDFFIVLRQARNIYGAQSEQAKYAKKAIAKLWEELKKEADQNADDKVTVDEWCAVLSTHSHDKQDPWFKEYMLFLFKLFDVSADTVIDKAEYTDGMHCYGYNEREAHDAFDAICPPVKGKMVTIDEKAFDALWLEYFYSTDKAAPGNNLFGVLPSDF